ncbi:MAG: hypothetical protein KDD74_18990, partial [Anaerolineales bacterium]|nr:hypothetical protein [Anaerolineales bacterium]
DFYTTSVTVTPNASDATSGINKIEAMIDNGAWTVINSPLFFADGNHSYQIRVTDNAGNVTETPVQTLYIDASPAVIAMLDDSLTLGDGLFYSIEDSQSGLTELRVVIKDNEGKYQRVTWVENLDGNSKYKDSVRWDGIFADGTYPTPGIYYIALKVINGAGVETIGTATIEVPVVKTAEQESIPALVVPALETVENTAIESAALQSEPAPQAFGNSNNPFTGNSIQTSFSANSTTTPTQSTTTSNVLWGGAAAALLGATLAEWQKKREEEAARLAAMRNSGGSGGEEDNDAADKKRMKALAKANPAYARSLAQQQSVKAAIAKVTAQELKGTNISVAQAQARQQAQWDANGQAIYAANQQFKETFGKEMDAATKEQAIKNATVNGVFNAGLYSVNLNTAQAKQEKAAEEQRRAEQASMLEAQRQAEEEATRQQALEDFRAGERNAVEIAEEYQREQAMQSYRAGEQVVIWEENNENFLFAIWNASMSAVGSALSPVKNIGELLSANRGGGPPTPWDKFVAWLGEQWGGFVTRWNELWQWEKQSTPKATPTVDPTVIAAIQSAQTQVSATQTAQVMPTASPTVTPTPVPTSMWVTYGANFWKDPSLVNNPSPENLVVGSGIPRTTEVMLTGAPPRLGANGFLYIQVKTVNGQTGWVVSTLLEGVVINPIPLVTSNKNVDIPANLINPNGPAQNLKLKVEDISSGKITPGDKEFWNLCGAFVTAYITKRPIDVLLNDWITASPSEAKSLLSIDSTTDIKDLKNILDIYGCEYYPLHNEPGNTWNTFLDEPFQVDLGQGNKIINVTPGKIQSQLDMGNQLILGVSINESGIITSSGDTPHWIVVDKVQPQGINDGQVLSYSSSPNSQEVNDYQIVIDAALKFIKINLKDNPNIDLDKVAINDNGPIGLFVNPNSCNPYIAPVATP